MEKITREFHDKIDLTCNVDQIEMVKKVIAFHPFVHCMEIITTNPNPPEFAQPNHEIYHILLDYMAFRDQDVVEDLFSPSTRFVSLSPVGTGNGLFVQRGVVVFSLNEATYKRFGLVGRKYGDTHLISIDYEHRQWLNRIQPFQPIEGLLVSKNISVYESFVKKSQIIENQIETWSPTKPLDFDMSTLGHGDWKLDLLKAMEKSLITRDEIAVNSDTQRMTVEGFMDVTTLEEWLSDLGREGYTIAMFWDMDDIPATYIGKQGTMTGSGGGCETLLFGKEVPQAVRYQTCLVRNEE